MSEISKTLSIVGTGLVLLIAGIIVQPRPAAPTNAEAERGTNLFKNFGDPEKAASMEIVSFNEKLGKKRDFKVQRINDRWVLPSHNNYPADARDQLINAAISLSQLEIQKIETSDVSKHDQYGVIDPTTAKAGSLGTGKLVVIKNAADETLANVIIGKEPRDIRTNEAQPGLRYVRVQNQDPIYLVKLTADKFSTNFEDWIETNLLKVNSYDVAELNLQDYTFDGQSQPRLRSLINLAFDDKKSEWSLKRMRAIVGGELKDVPLESDEELNSIKLNDLKSALADLKIVDVEKKPDSLIKVMSQEKGAAITQLEQAELQDRGFFIVPVQGGGMVLRSKEGEVICNLKDGIRYVLRFGEFDQRLNTEEEKPADAKTDPAAPKGPKINRYIMVEAHFDPKAIPLPTYLPVPGEEPKDASKDAPANDKKSDDEVGKGDADKSGAKSDADKAGANKAGADKAGSDKGGNSGKASPANSKSGTSTRSDAEKNFHLVAYQNPKADPAKSKNGKSDSTKSNAKSKAKSGSEDAGKSDSKDATKSKPQPDAKDASKSDTKDGKGGTKGDDSSKAAPKSEPATPDEADAEIKELERKRAIQENERLKADYDKKIKEGESKARQLNNRFAEWYYVISDEVYKKIHLSKDDIIQKKKPEGGAPNGGNPFGGLKDLPSGLGQ